jgi:hypothetical protein
MPHLLLLDSGPDIAHLPSHLQSWEDTRRSSCCTNGAMLTVALGTVGHGTALMVPTLDCACGEEMRPRA